MKLKNPFKAAYKWVKNKITTPNQAAQAAPVIAAAPVTAPATINDSSASAESEYDTSPSATTGNEGLEKSDRSQGDDDDDELVSSSDLTTQAKKVPANALKASEPASSVASPLSADSESSEEEKPAKKVKKSAQKKENVEPAEDEPSSEPIDAQRPPRRKGSAKKTEQVEPAQTEDELSGEESVVHITYSADDVKEALGDILADALKHQDKKQKKGAYKNIGATTAHIIGLALAVPTLGGSLIINAGATFVTASGVNNIKHARADKKALRKYRDHPLDETVTVKDLNEEYKMIPYEALARAFTELHNERHFDPTTKIPVSYWLKAVGHMYDQLAALPQVGARLTADEIEDLTQAFADDVVNSVGRTKTEKVAHWVGKYMKWVPGSTKMVKYHPAKPLSDEDTLTETLATSSAPYQRVLDNANAREEERRKDDAEAREKEKLQLKRDELELRRLELKLEEKKWAEKHPSRHSQKDSATPGNTHLKRHDSYSSSASGSDSDSARSSSSRS